MGVFPPLDHPLSDGVVALRRWRDEDADDLAVMARDPEIVRWTTVPSPYRLEDAVHWIELSRERWETDVGAALAVESVGDGELLASIDIRNIAPGTGVAEIGYMVGPNARRRGVATRAVDLITRWGFEACGFARIEIQVTPENEVSMKVPPRVGFQREGLLRSYRPGRDGTRPDLVMWSRLPGDVP
jgi:RimJ/RimL family protein N-acetyltransferase